VEEVEAAEEVDTAEADMAGEDREEADNTSGLGNRRSGSWADSRWACLSQAYSTWIDRSH